jgi:SNF2 family DNA or RNA helicase
VNETVTQVSLSPPQLGVGDRVSHARFGVGLVVDVRAREGHDILEVVFPDAVRMIDSAHPLLSRAAPLDVDRSDVADSVEWEWDAEGEAVLTAYRNGETDSPARVALLIEAERLSVVRGFDRLLALDAVRDVTRYPHQIEACGRVLRDMHGRALLADEVGLGKTIEAGLILKEYVIRGLVRSALVLAPVSLQVQWQEELSAKFDLPFVLHGRRDGWEHAPFLISSLETAKTRRNDVQIRARGFDLVIVDEAHRLKNHRTLGWGFLNLLTAPYLLLLTATPVQNDLRELYNLITLIRPGALGTYPAFRRTYTMHGDKRRPRNVEALGRLLSTLMVRNTRATAGIATTKRFVETISFELAGEERRLYDAVSSFVRSLMRRPEGGIRSGWYFTLLTLQKEVGSSAAAARSTLERMIGDERYVEERPALATLERRARAVTESRKRDALLALQNVMTEPTIVFTQFRATLMELADALLHAGHAISIFHGSLSAEEKDSAVRRFREEGGVLLSTEAGGEGRNLQFCRNVINYDLPWNPMRLEQRIGRVYRLGQRRDVRVYNFAAAGTVEAYVLDLLHRKIRMFELVIGEMEMVLGAMKDDRSFDDLIFRIWASSDDPQELLVQFDALGEDVQYARRQYEAIKELDRSVLDGVEASRRNGRACARTASAARRTQNNGATR